MTSNISKTAFACAIAALASSTHASEKLEEVVVTASRNETPLRQVGASVSVMDAAEIQLQAATTLNDILRNQPGIATSNSGGLGKDSALRIRGEEGYRTLILIDGIEMTDPTGTQAMSHVEHLNMATDIERIEILRGPQGFIYGADAGGVVNLFTRSSSEGIDGRIAIEGGSYNTQKINASLSGGNQQVDAFISGALLSSDGFNARSDDASGEEDGYENTTLHARGGVNFSETLRAQLVVRSQSANSEYDNCGSTNNLCDSDFDQDVARLSLRYENATSHHRLAYSVSDIERLFYTDNAEAYGISGSLKKAEYLGDTKFHPSLTAVWGSDYKQETIDARDGDAENSRDQLGLFAELQSQLAEAVYFTAGLRYDDNEDFGTHNSYRVTAAWLPLQSAQQTLKLRSSAGTGFRAPALSEIAYNKGPWAFGAASSIDLKEETSRGLDVGLDYFREFANAQTLNLEMTAFSQEVENEIYFDLTDYTGYLQANGKSKSYGIELGLDFAISAMVDILANITWNPTEDRDGEQRVRRPENTGNLGARLNLQNNVTLLANLFSSKNAKDIDGSTMDDYHLLSLSANWEMGDWLFTGRIDNLTDETYQQVSGYNTAERNFMAGLQYQF